MANTNKGVVANFTDRYGTERAIHGTRQGLKVQRQTSTVVLRLTGPVAEIVGSRIRDRRLALGLSLEALCLRAGLVSSTPKSRMWEIENNVRKDGLRFGTLYALAWALGIEVGELFPTVSEALELAGIETQMMESLHA